MRATDTNIAGPDARRDDNPFYDLWVNRLDIRGMLETHDIDPGASFMASGGYHHHIAGNIWNSRGAGARGEGELGLAWFELVARDEADFEAMRQRILSQGGEDHAEGPSILDPWGNRLVLRR